MHQSPITHNFFYNYNFIYNCLIEVIFYAANVADSGFLGFLVGLFFNFPKENNDKK
jgi:hypothetical protein